MFIKKEGEKSLLKNKMDTLKTGNFSKTQQVKLIHSSQVFKEQNVATLHGGEAGMLVVGVCISMWRC